MKFCSNCGYGVPDEAVFCGNCGKRLVPDETIPTEEQSVPAGNASQSGKTSPEEDARTGPVSALIPVPTAQNSDDSIGKGRILTYDISPRSIPLCIFLAIITCGIYGIYWMVKLNDEINLLSGETKATEGILVFVFCLITCGIYGIYWYYKMGERVDRITGSPSSDNILFIILGIFGFGIIAYAIMQDTVNKEVE